MWPLSSACKGTVPTQRLGARHALPGRAVPWGAQQLPRNFQRSGGVQFGVDGGVTALGHQQMEKVGWAVALRVHHFAAAFP